MFIKVTNKKTDVTVFLNKSHITTMVPHGNNGTTLGLLGITAPFEAAETIEHILDQMEQGWE